jgi:hypothetical protein
MHAVSAAAFGAHGGMGTGDDPQDAHLAIDGLRGTAWHSDWYTTPGSGTSGWSGRPAGLSGSVIRLRPGAGNTVG